MMEHLQTVNRSLDLWFLSLQGFVVVFLLLHDWIPLGRLNNVRAMRGEDSFTHRAFVTVVGALPAAICFYFCAMHFERSYSRDLMVLLWITYAAFLLGVLRAWWIPYLFVPDKTRAARYAILFAGTHSFLPRRNGIRPDTLHTTFHVAVLAILAILGVRS